MRDCWYSLLVSIRSHRLDCESNSSHLIIHIEAADEQNEMKSYLTEYVSLPLSLTRMYCVCANRPWFIPHCVTFLSRDFHLMLLVYFFRRSLFFGIFFFFCFSSYRRRPMCQFRGEPEKIYGRLRAENVQVVYSHKWRRWVCTIRFLEFGVFPAPISRHLTSQSAGLVHIFDFIQDSTRKSVAVGHQMVHLSEKFATSDA